MSYDTASITKPHMVSVGVTVSRLHSGLFALCAHDGEKRVIVTLTHHECRNLAHQMQQLTKPGKS